MSNLSIFLKNYFSLFENGIINDLDEEYIYHIVKLILENDPDEANSKDSTIHRTPSLTIAVKMGLIEIVRLLIEFGVDINICDNDNTTALMSACINNEFEIVKLLCEQENIDLDAVDSEGITALMYCVDENCIQSGRELILHGVNPHIKNNFGFSASETARENNFIQFATLIELAEEQYNNDQ